MRERMHGSGKTAFFLNPNAPEEMTASMQQALSPFNGAGMSFRCITSHAGLAIIQSRRDVDLCVPRMLALADSVMQDALGFVAAYVSDPGLRSLREMTKLLVVRLLEASVCFAMSLGNRLGIIAMARPSVVRQRRSIAAAQISGRWAGRRPLHPSPGAYSDFEAKFPAMVETGRALRDIDGADRLVLGCSGVAGRRGRLEEMLNVPVVDPVEAAASLLLGQLLESRSAASRRTVSPVV